MNFKKKDQVEFGGLIGEVVRDDLAGAYPLLVRFDNDIERQFTLDGRMFTIHTKPLLNLVHRPKNLVKKKGWIGVRERNGIGYYTTNIFLIRESIQPYLEDGYTVQEIEFEVEE